MFSNAGIQADAIVGCGTESIAAGLQPFEANQREPAIRRGEVLRALVAPLLEAFFPVGIDRCCCGAECHNRCSRESRKTL
jgi:hypothetical protein